MLQMNQPLRAPEVRPPPGPPEARVLPTPPDPPRRWPWIAGGVVIIVAAVAAAFSWLLSSTVSESDYDEVVAELTASEEAVDALETEVDALGAENEGLAAALSVETDRVAEAEETADSLSSRLDAALSSVKYQAYLALNWFPEDVAAMQEVGLDTATADALLAELGETETWIEWVETDNAWLMQDKALADIDDDALTAAWVRWNNAEFGSFEELAAWAEFTNRLAYLSLEPVAGS
jgi:hypothetical protein